MSPQIASLVRGLLKAGGAASAAAGVLDPNLGHAVSTIFTDLGSLAMAGGFVWSYFVHKQAAR